MYDLLLHTPWFLLATFILLYFPSYSHRSTSFLSLRLKECDELMLTPTSICVPLLQAPRSSLEALGFHPASSLANEEDGDDDDDDFDTKANRKMKDSKSNGDRGDVEEEEESSSSIEMRKNEARLRAHFSGPLLAGQIASLASSAVKDKESKSVLAIILNFVWAVVYCVGAWYHFFGITTPV